MIPDQFYLRRADDMSTTGLIRVQVSLPMDSNLPEDAATNTWYFQKADTADPSEAQFNGGPRGVLDLVYTSLFSNGILSSAINHTALTYKAYKHATAQTAPEFTGSIQVLASPTGVAAPPELAVCLSFANDSATTVPVARRRGRLYIGPLGFLSGPAVPTTQRDVIRGIGASVLTDLAAAPVSGWKWVVYSSAQNDAFEVQRGWVDNAYDVQRRRGVDATNRATFP